VESVMSASGFGSRLPAQSSAAGAVTTPTVCPGCKSQSIATTARRPDEHSYWRCRNCGEIWNVARRDTRPQGFRTWR